MKNDEIRNLLAETALAKVGKTRQELGYKCEETCAEGATDVLNTVAKEYSIEGLNVGSVSCNTMYANMSQSPYWYEPNDWMVRGDFILFDWDRINEDKPIDHVGICIDVDNNVMTYANINGNDHNKWTVQTISKFDKSIAYWMRYLNPTPKTETANTTSNRKQEIYNKVKDLQSQRDELNNRINELINSLYTV